MKRTKIWKQLLSTKCWTASMEKETEVRMGPRLNIPILQNWPNYGFVECEDS